VRQDSSIFWFSWLIWCFFWSLGNMKHQGIASQGQMRLILYIHVLLHIFWYIFISGWFIQIHMEHAHIYYKYNIYIHSGYGRYSCVLGHFVGFVNFGEVRSSANNAENGVNKDLRASRIAYWLTKWWDLYIWWRPSQPILEFELEWVFPEPLGTYIQAHCCRLM